MAFHRANFRAFCVVILTCSLFVIAKERHSKRHHYYNKHRNRHTEDSSALKRDQIWPKRSVYSFSSNDHGIHHQRTHQSKDTKRQNIEVAEVLKDLAELATAVSEGPNPNQVQAQMAGQPGLQLPTPQPMNQAPVTVLATAGPSIPVTELPTDGTLTSPTIGTPLTLGTTNAPTANAPNATTTTPKPVTNATTPQPQTTLQPTTAPTKAPLTEAPSTNTTELLEWLKKLMGQFGGGGFPIMPIPGGGGQPIGIPGLLLPGGGTLPLPGIGGIPGVIQPIPGQGGLQPSPGGGLPVLPNVITPPEATGGSTVTETSTSTSTESAGVDVGTHITMPAISLGGSTAVSGQGISSALAEIKITISPDGKITINHPSIPGGRTISMPGLVNGKLPGLDPKGWLYTLLIHQF